MSESKLAALFEWLNYSVDQGVLPSNMTTWEWDTVHASFRTERSTFMPNHAEIGRYNATTCLGIQAVETGRMEPKEAAAFVVDVYVAFTDMGQTLRASVRPTARRVSAGSCSVAAEMRIAQRTFASTMRPVSGQCLIANLTQTVALESSIGHVCRVPFLPDLTQCTDRLPLIWSGAGGP